MLISDNDAITSETSVVYIDDNANNVHRAIHCENGSVSQVTMELNGTNYVFDVIGFNHDDLTTATAYGAETATGKAGITFQMHDVFATTYVMRSDGYNTNGWNGSDMRSTTMPLMKGYMPTAWQGIIKAVNKISGVGGDAPRGTQTASDECFLLAEGEIFGSCINSYLDEQAAVTQYQYYKAGNSKSKNRSGSANYWWDRSPYSGNSYRFCGVNNIGVANYADADYSFGVSFAFCV